MHSEATKTAGCKTSRKVRLVLRPDKAQRVAKNLEDITMPPAYRQPLSCFH